MTASLVGPNLILTAAHGLVRNGRLRSGNFIFRPDFGSRHNRTNDFATVTRVWLGSYTPDRPDCRHADWAILQIDANLGDAYGTLRVEDTDGVTLAENNRGYYMSSYNRDFKHGAVACWQTGCGFVSLDPLGYLLHDFSTDRGASGAPIFYFVGPGQDARIVALNVAETGAHDRTLYGVPFSPRVANVAVSSHEFFQTLSDILAEKDSASGGQAVGATDFPNGIKSRSIHVRSNSG
jgi:V8-like Glu-specific endopeptidase